MKEGKRWLVVAGYAVAMAWVEAAVVYYLRTMANRINPYQADPLPQVAGLGWVELVREAATLVMLLSVGLMAGRDWRSRWGYAAVAFGIWDIFYYVFLKVMTGWPHSPLDWDILFLLPLPWWGPVAAPVIIAGMMIVWGTLTSQHGHGGGQSGCGWKPWVLNFTGMTLALGVFMADSLEAAHQGPGAIREVLPAQFKWGWFALAALLMSAPIVDLGWKFWRRQRASPHNTLARYR